MPSRFSNKHKALVLLPCIFYCASCAPQPQTCIRCSLSCDGAMEQLKQLKSVHVRVEHRSDPVLDDTFSSLCDGGRCSVPGCFQRDATYTLHVYTDNDHVPQLLYETNVQPDCGPEGISDRSNDADTSCSNKLLILLTCCLWMIFHL